MKKKDNNLVIKWCFGIALALSIISMILYTVKGSAVDSDGTLLESFYLIPIGFLFILIAVVCWLILLSRKYKKKK